MKTLLAFLLLTGVASAQLGSKHPNGHWSYPGVQTNPELITPHLLSDHRHELKQSLDGLTIDQQQTLHDLIHIKRRSGSVYCVPYIGPKFLDNSIKLKSVIKPVVKELVLLNI